MNTTRSIPVGQSRRISPLERAVAMRLLTPGPVSRERMARALAVDPADVAAIMRGLEEEGVVVGLCEDKGRKRTAWILAGIDTKMIHALRKAKRCTPDELSTATGETLAKARAWLKASLKKRTVEKVEGSNNCQLAYMLISTEPAAVEPVQCELVARLTERESLFLKTLKLRPMMVSEIARANGKRLGGTDIKVLERLKQAGLVTDSVDERGNRIWRIA